MTEFVIKSNKITFDSQNRIYQKIKRTHAVKTSRKKAISKNTASNSPAANSPYARLHIEVIIGPS